MTYPTADELARRPRVFGPTSPATVLTLRPLGDEPLEPHLMDVIELVADGLTNQKIGSVLGISEDAVKSRLRVLFHRLRVRDRVQLVVAGFRTGVLRHPYELDHRTSCAVFVPRPCTCGADPTPSRPTEETPTS